MGAKGRHRMPRAGRGPPLLLTAGVAGRTRVGSLAALPGGESLAGIVDPARD